MSSAGTGAEIAGYLVRSDGPHFGAGPTIRHPVSARQPAPGAAAAAAARAASRLGRSGARRRRGTTTRRGHGHEYMTLTETETEPMTATASTNGAGPLGFVGTVDHEAARAPAGLTATAGGDGANIPMMPATWPERTDPSEFREIGR
ncbi:hypothetical protein B8W67_17795 [Mycolicibacillus koreensis]|uniref:PPE-PPW subfamily C-terminal domain-containing protein n=1 Tax=Mycolicibacillus koreensis TaxID=1069220 RepID=A0AA91SQ82_9MYCO|nr:hypothetical protein B8W67_17795 [Mycolicibacillus koreensis]